MLFNFGLFPFPELISEIEVSEDEDSRSPHWFRLSDGWYWIDVGETHLFRYTLEAVKLWQPLRASSGLYADYFLSAFFRDLLEHLPAMLEPIPPALAERLSSIGVWNDWIAARDECVCDEEEEEDIDDEAMEEGDFYADGVRWWYERSIYVAHLTSGPRIWIWNDGTNIHIGWDNRDRLFNGMRVWEAQTGQTALPMADFVKELLAFDHQLMEAMAERIVAARDYWTDPRFADDLLSLQKEHQDYTVMLQNTLHEAMCKPLTNWERVLSSIAAYDCFSKADHSSD